MKQITVTAVTGIILLALLALGVFFLPRYLSPISQDINNNTQDMVGNDADEHGCIGSAGYSWCEPKQKCLRIWEEPCEDVSTETDKNYALLLVLKQDTQIEFGDIKTKELTWNTDQNTSVPVIGLGFSAESLAEDKSNVVAEFLLNNEFAKDSANSEQNDAQYSLGYIKDENETSTVCKVSVSESTDSTSTETKPQYELLVICATLSTTTP